MGHETDPAHVLVPVGGGESEVPTQRPADDVAVEDLNQVTLLEESLRQAKGNGGLAGRGEAREPDCQPVAKSFPRRFGRIPIAWLRSPTGWQRVRHPSTRLSSWGSPVRPSPVIVADQTLAGDLATSAGRLLVALRTDLAEAEAGFRREQGDCQSAELILTNAGARAARIARGAGRGRCRRWTATYLQARCGSSTPSMAPVTSASPVVTTGRFTSRSGRPTGWWRGRSRSRLPVSSSRRGPPRPCPPRHPGPLRIAASRTRAPAMVHQGRPRTFCRSGADGLGRGEGDGCCHRSRRCVHPRRRTIRVGLSPPSPVAVATAAGLHASRLDGSALVYNRPDAWLPDLVVCRQELAGQILAITAG